LKLLFLAIHELEETSGSEGLTSGHEEEIDVEALLVEAAALANQAKGALAAEQAVEPDVLTLISRDVKEHEDPDELNGVLAQVEDELRLERDLARPVTNPIGDQDHGERLAASSAAILGGGGLLKSWADYGPGFVDDVDEHDKKQHRKHSRRRHKRTTHNRRSSSSGSESGTSHSSPSSSEESS
jgi:hypothetical protein